MLGSASTYTFVALRSVSYSVRPAGWFCDGAGMLFWQYSWLPVFRVPHFNLHNGFTFLSFLHLSFYLDKCEFKGSLSGSNAGITSIEFDSAVST